jgi:hypothetical protein
MNKPNNHLSRQTIRHKKDHNVWDWKSSCARVQGQAEKCDRIKSFNAITTPPPDNWITNDNTHIILIDLLC